MMELIAAWFLPAFLIGIASVLLVAKINKKKGIIGVDINKPSETRIPESVGISMLIPIIALSLFAISIKPLSENAANIASWLAIITAFALIGLMDDIKPKFLGKTRSWRLRAIVVAIISIAFTAIHFQPIPLIIIAALYLAGTASFQNTFAGLNGWEIGSGFIISVFFSLLLLFSGSPLLPISLIISGTILSILVFNFYPAKVFPGDSGTLLIGSALSGIMIIMGNWKLMVFSFLFFLPHVVDFIAKMLTNPKDPSQRKTKPYKLNAQKKIDIPDYKGRKKYDFAKILIALLGPKKEPVLVAIIWAIVILNCSFWTALFVSI